MKTRVTETELVAFVLGELAPADRERVAATVAADPALAAEAAEFRRLLGDLRRSAPEAPPVHWARYRADLRARMATQAEHPRWLAWVRWPVPLALSASLAGVLLVLAAQGSFRTGERQDVTALEETLGTRIEMLRDFHVVERLDLLEDLDILRSLSEAPGSREG